MQPLIRTAMARVHAHCAALYASIPAMRETAFLAMQGKAPAPVRRRGKPPQRVAVGENSMDVCNAVDVFFKKEGEKEFIRQTVCTVADVQRGYIERYVKSRGRVGIAEDGKQAKTETLYGQVRIKWRANATE